MTRKGLTRVSEGVYRNRLGNLVHVISSRNRTKARKVDGQRKNQVRGREVSVRDSASDGQVIYGLMRVGGVYSFLDTNSDSKAYLRTGADNSQIVWIAKTAGSVGNGISVTIVCTGTQGSILVTVVGDDITVRVKSTSGTSESTASQVIAAIQADGSANALVTVHKGDGTGAGLVQAETIQSLTGGGGTWLHHYITLACHEIYSIEALYLDDRTVTFGGTPDPRWAIGDFLNKVFMGPVNGLDSQPVQPDLQAQVGSSVWTDNHRQRGCAGAYLITVWSASLFPNGMPDVAFLVKGKLCYDFRTSTTVWTQNAALIIADVLMNTKFGLGVALADMDTTSWQDAADICDESVALSGGGTEARYTINGVFDTSSTPQQILEDMAQAIAGDIVYQGGKWYCYPGEYRSPTLTFTEDDMRGELKVVTTVPRRDRFNSVKGTYVSTEKYQETDYPAVTNSTYVTEDGEVVWANVNQPFVTSAPQCQRVAKIELERVRQGIEIVATFSTRALNLQVSDTFQFTYPKFGWSSKVFEVRDVVIEETSGAGIMVTVRANETSSGVYTWSAEETTVDLAPNTNLPDPTNVTAPSGLTLTSGTAELYVRNDGSVFSRLKVAWTAPNDIYVIDGGHFDIQYKQSSLSVWQNAAPATGDSVFTYLLEVQDGVNYDVRVRSVNAIGAVSDWVTETAHTVLGKSAPPSNVSGFAAVITDDGIALSWTQISDVDRDQFELRLGATWGAATLIARVKGSGTSYLYPYRTAGSITISIKAVDTSGNYSTTESSLTLTLEGPDPIQSFVIKTINNNVLLDWEAPVTTTFSVKEYDVYKGIDFATAEKIGTVFGSFHAYLEDVGGNFTYWVVAIDAGGNRSTELSQSATVRASTDFFVLESLDPVPEFTEYESAIIGGSDNAPSEDPGSVWIPFPTFVTGGIFPIMRELGPTWTEWFIANGWTSFQDAIDAGFENYLSPSLLGQGFFVLKVDLGASFASGFLAWTWSEEVLGDSAPVAVPTISVSADDVTYTEHAGASQVFATGFRYVKLRMDFTVIEEHQLSRLYDHLLVVNLQRDEETGIASVLAADVGSGGTVVTFTKDWADVEDIQLTGEGTTFRTPVLNFTDIANPTLFKILVFDEDGVAMDSSVRYRVRGALAGT